MDAIIKKMSLALFMLALVSACASTLTATVDRDPAFDFSDVRSIAIAPLNRSVTPQTALSDLQAERIAQSLADELGRRGMRVTGDLSDADMILTWHLVTQERTDIRTYNSMSARYTTCWSCPRSSSQNVRVRQFTQGTMIVDLLDPAQGRSVWRSIVESRLRPGMSPEDAADLRASAAAALFADFPPG
jgi:hypothetical protein